MRQFMALFGVAGLALAGLALAAPAGAQQPRASSVEAGIYIEFGPSFVDYQNIESGERCRDLCLQDQRCKVWRYVGGTAPAEYGRARRVCVLSDRAPQTRTKPGNWVTSGQVR